MRKSLFLLAAVLGVASLAFARTPPPLASGNSPGVATNAAAASIRQASSPLVTVPAETEADIQLLSGLHSSVSHQGDPFAAELVHPIRVGGRIVVPAGSVVDGHITYVRHAGRLRRAAELGLRFEIVTLPDGHAQPISAILTTLDAMPPTHASVDSEGVLRGKGVGTWKRLTGGLLGLGAVSAIGAQIGGAAALGVALPVGGGAVLGYSFLIPKGNDVHLPPDTRMRIRLRKPMTFRVNW